MRICHIIWELNTGGIETMLVNIINEQIKTEQVLLIIINDDINDELLGQIDKRCQVRLLHRKIGSKNLFSLIRMNGWIWKYQPDIIHVHTVRTSKVVFSRKPIVRTIHNTHNVTNEYSRMKALYAISNSVYDYTRQQGFHSTVVLNGIPVASIVPKTSYSLVDGVYHVVQVSRLCVDQKGQDIAIRAIDQLVNKRDVKNVKLHFVGDGEDRKMLEDLVEEMALSDYVVFEGLRPRDYIFAHLKDYDLYLQPSRYEGFGLTVAEGCAARLPILVSDIEGPVEIIDGGRLGMTFRNMNVNDLAEKLESVCRGNYDYSLIELAYQRVVKEYDVSVTARKYIEEYYKVIKNEKT